MTIRERTEELEERMQEFMPEGRWLIFIFLCLSFAAVKQKLPI